MPKSEQAEAFIPAPVVPEETLAGDQTEALSNKMPAVAPPPHSASNVPAEQIAKSVESQIDQATKLPNQVKQSELGKKLERLEAIASPESVEEVSSTIASTMGLDRELYADKEPPAEGLFDFDSAQIKDVERIESESGNDRYEAVMVDSEGRTMRVPMTTEEGQSLYETFGRLKSFPMAKGIYQSVVMPMIQKLLEESQGMKTPEVIRPDNGGTP